MRRGGRLFVLVGILFALFAAFGLYLYLQSTGGAQVTDLSLLTPTAEPLKRVVVARIDIPNTTVLTDTETFLSLEEIPESEYNANPAQYFTSFSDLRNKQTILTVSAGDPVRSTDVTDAGLSLQIPPGQQGQPRPKAFPFQVNSLTGVADLITPGDFVDVIASFQVQVPLIRVGVNEQGQPTLEENETFEGQTTKTLVQNVQVLQILKPQVPAEVTPGAEGAQPAEEPPPGGAPADGTNPPSAPNAANTFTPGNWLLVLAVTDQQAEIIKFAQERGQSVTLVLRGRGDTAQETTEGVTLELLVARFALPVPGQVEDPDATPVPTPAPAPPTAP
ncbi:MAG TPA: Flp pilus assembly protein CpaB [Roseiflexaceae bacterium]|nr:Flp pilus assembly protein CpaB [Roseiflexaceae bacterium]